MEEEDNTVQERRKTARREEDRAMREQLDHYARAMEQRVPDKASSDQTKRSRRRAVRHNCKVAIRMSIGHAAGHDDTWSVDTLKVDGRLLDLSTEGASLFTKDPFQTAQNLQLVIELQDKTKISAKAVVRWVKAVPKKGGYASGVRLMDLATKDQKRIASFLSKLDATAGL